MSNEKEIDVIIDRQGQVEEVGVYAQAETLDHVPHQETLLEHLGRAARENPASAALVGAGLAWILLGGARKGLLPEGRPVAAAGNLVAQGARSVARGANAAGTAVSDAARAATSVAGQTAKAVGDAIATTAESAQDAALRAGKTVGRTARAGVGAADEAAAKSVDAAGRETSRAEGYVEDAARRTGSALSQAGQEIVENLRDGAAAVQQGSVRARRAASDMAQNQPFLLGALCLAAGAGVASLLPRTRTENELLGEYSGEAVQAARKAAVELVAGSVRTARAKTSEAVQEAARKAAEDAAERVLRQADSIGDAVVNTFDKVSRDVTTGKGASPARDEAKGTRTA